MPNSQGGVSASHSPTLAFLCPLFIELKAVRATFDEEFGSKKIDKITCYYGRIHSRQAVATHLQLNGTGPADAASRATSLIDHHESLQDPSSYYFLVGIAGGIWSQRQDVRLGDVVIATTVWNWPAGKITQHGFEHSKHPEDAPDRILQALPGFLDRRERIGRLIVEQIERMQHGPGGSDDRWVYPGQEKDVLFHAEYPHASGKTCESCDTQKVIQRDVRSDSFPQVHDGKVASGTVVLKNAEHRAALQREDVLAVEMEACGVLRPHKFIVVRGISDYADSHKNDKWHGYAAATAAACSRLLIESLLEDDQPSHRPSSTPTEPPRPDSESTVSEHENSPDTSTTDDSNSSASDSPFWAPCFQCNADEVSIKVGDVSEDPNAPKELYHKARILIEVQSHTDLQQKRQRIKIVATSSKSAPTQALWLPLTNVRVEKADSSVSIQFSNCKQKSIESVNHHESYSLVYDPTNPNVHLQIACAEESEALELTAFLLQKKQHLITEMNDEIYEFSSCTTRNGTINLSGDRHKAVFVWYHLDGSNVFDMAFFNNKLDLELERSEDTTQLRLRLVSKLDYEPEDVGLSIYWPPPEVEANKEGHPSCAKLTNTSSLGNTITLISPSNTLTDLMNATIGYATASTFMGWYEADFPRSRRPSLISKKPGQLMIWKRDDTLFCVVRYGDGDSQCDREWISWTSTTKNGNDACIPRLEMSKNQVHLKNLQISSGDHLSLRPNSLFEAQCSDETESGQSSKKTEMKVYFRNDADLEAFQKVVADYVEID